MSALGIRVGYVYSVFMLLGLVVCSVADESTQSVRQEHKREIIIVSIDHCPPCAKMTKEIGKLRELAGPAVVIKQVYNIHEAIERMYQVTIRSFPTILVVVDGKVVQSFSRYYPAHTLWDMIDKSLLYL